jgi:DeoR/GlpR family transcriptional regulator of sugar metabolism
MILFELRQFLKEQHTVSLKELCEHFESSEEAMEEMLQIWVRKGYLQPTPPYPVAVAVTSTAPAPNTSAGKINCSHCEPTLNGTRSSFF